jgi:predicted esterase
MTDRFRLSSTWALRFAEHHIAVAALPATNKRKPEPSLAPARAKTVINLWPGVAPRSEHEYSKHGIADGIQAIKVVRAHAAEWGISPERVVLAGFSAGAILTSAVVLHSGWSQWA